MTATGWPKLSAGLELLPGEATLTGPLSRAHEGVATFVAVGGVIRFVIVPWWAAIAAFAYFEVTGYDDLDINKLRDLTFSFNGPGFLDQNRVPILHWPMPDEKY